MYHLPSDAPIDEYCGHFRGKTLVQACFGKHDLILHLDPGIIIAIFSSIGVGRKDQPVQRRTDPKKAAEELFDSLNTDVVDANWSREGDLSLVFNNGSILEVYNDSDQFECYTVTIGKTLIVV